MKHKKIVNKLGIWIFPNIKVCVILPSTFTPWSTTFLERFCLGIFSIKKCSKIRMKTVKQAIKNEFDVDLKDQNLELIVDGGSENNNKTIAEFIKKIARSISTRRLL